MIHGRAVRFRIFEPPEVEDAYPVHLKDAHQLKPAFQEFILLLEGEVGAKLVAFRTEPGERCARPIHFEDGRGNRRDAQLVLFQNPPCFSDLLSVQFHDVLAPHPPYFDVLEAELLRGDFSRTPEVLRDLVIDY